jgi:enoyl-CoA hydratase/carnithine racemase
MSDLLKLEIRGGIAIVTFNNPPANTWTPESLSYLQTIVADLNQDASNRTLILRSDSEKFYSGGADLTRFNHDDKAKSFEFSQAFGEAFEALTNYKGVSIAPITGFAMGGGLEVALACDVRICESQAQMALPEATVGLLPCGLGSQHLAWLVGEQWAKRMMLIGERIKAPQAEKIGLVSEVVETGKSFERALELAAKVENQSPTSTRYCKELIMAARDGNINSAFTKERELFVKLWEDGNQIEGVSAFVEKRKAQWKNS